MRIAFLALSLLPFLAHGGAINSENVKKWMTSKNVSMVNVSDCNMKEKNRSCGFSCSYLNRDGNIVNLKNVTRIYSGDSETEKLFLVVSEVTGAYKKDDFTTNRFIEFPRGQAACVSYGMKYVNKY